MSQVARHLALYLPDIALNTENQRVCRAGVWWRIALAGVCAGLLPYTYIPARLTPFLFLLFGLSFLLTWGSKRERGESKESSSRSFGFSLNTSRLRTELPWAGVFLGVAGLVAAPILIHFALHPEHFFVRIEAVWFLRENQGTPLEILLNNVWKHLSVFGFFGGRAEWYGFSGQPLLNSWEGVFFWLGAGTAAWRWQQPAYRLLLLWLGVLVLPAMLALDTGQEPSTLRLIGAVPAVYLLIGVGMWEVFRVLRQRWGALSRGGHPIFPGFNAWVPIVLGGVACALILGQGIVTYFTYFERWATAPEVNETYEGVWTELAKTLNAQPSDEETVYLLPFRYGEHYSFDYLYQGKMSTDVVRGNIPSLPQEIESSVAAVENVHTVKLVDWNNDSISGDAYAEEHIAVLLDKYGRYLGSDEYADFQIHTYTDVALGRPWTLYDQLEPLTVEYDGGIALQGYALGRGQESSCHLSNCLHCERIAPCGWHCGGNSPPGWISTIRYRCACTVPRAEESIRRIWPCGSRGVCLQAAKGHPNHSIRWSRLIFRLISSPANTSCVWWSMTPRP